MRTNEYDFLNHQWLFFLLQMPNGKSMDKAKTSYSDDEGLYDCWVFFFSDLK